MDHEATEDRPSPSHHAVISAASRVQTDEQVVATAPESSSTRRRPNLFLVITNISKRRNIRALLQTAAGFGCKKVLVVGQKTFDMSVEGPDVPAFLREHVRNGGMPIQRFPHWKDCTAYLNEHRIRLVGVEIHEDAKLVESFFDSTDTAFLMGNEGQGLNEKQMQACDAFVRIPQYGQGTASLNVYVAAGIVLHRYHEWQRQCELGTSGD